MEGRQSECVRPGSEVKREEQGGTKSESETHGRELGSLSSSDALLGPNGSCWELEVRRRSYTGKKRV